MASRPVSFCPSAHRGERVSSPRRAVRHGGHSHHVACAAASRLASPGKANRHRPQRRDGGGRSTSAVLSSAYLASMCWCSVELLFRHPLASPPEQCRQGDSTDEGNEQLGQRALCSPSHSFGLGRHVAVPAHVEHIDAVQRRATVRRSHPLRPTLCHVATCSRTTGTRRCQRPRLVRVESRGRSALWSPSFIDVIPSGIERRSRPSVGRLDTSAYVRNRLLATNNRKYAL